MFRSAMLTAAATLALGALSATPAEAFMLAPPTPIADRGQDECAAGPVVRVGRRLPNLDECAAGPVVPVGRRIANHDECAAEPVVRVGRRLP